MNYVDTVIPVRMRNQTKTKATKLTNLTTILVIENEISQSSRRRQLCVGTFTYDTNTLLPNLYTSCFSFGDTESDYGRHRE